VQEGMGGFLCPPGHPMHTCHIQTDLRRRVENRGCMSLDAIDCDYLDDATRAQARQLLDKWRVLDRLALDAPEVQEWILQVLGYFQGCYNLGDPNEPEEWHVTNLAIRQESFDPLEHADHHAGVHLIRKYYPEFQPTADHFARAYWGQKPEGRP